MKTLKSFFTGGAEIGVERGGCAGLFLFIMLLGSLMMFIFFQVIVSILNLFA